MRKMKINMTFDVFTLRQPWVSAIIQKCVEATLDSEGVSVPCEINVFVTNDKGIQAINAASRNIDKATDVLSFPMFHVVSPSTGSIGNTMLRRALTKSLKYRTALAPF